MKVIEGIKSIPTGQLLRYEIIIFSCTLFFSPFLFLPSLVDNPDLCGKVCIRRFYLYFPGMNTADFASNVQVSSIGVYILSLILITTFFFGRLWCGYICPVGGLPEVISRTFSDKWKIEYRSLPQVPIRYGYFSSYVFLMPMFGISACTLCNFITIPRIFDVMSGNPKGLAFALSAVGLVNLALLFLLGFFATKGRAYCQFLCPIGAMDGLVNRLGAKLRFTRRIRVERNRCTGCNICARNCMTGAIKMENRIAVVDQLSCMSCNECVDVCDWNAIEWRTAHLEEDPKRRKKGVEYFPPLEWEAVRMPTEPSPNKKESLKQHWQKLVLCSLFAMALVFVGFTRTPGTSQQPGSPSTVMKSTVMKNTVMKNTIMKSTVITDSSLALTAND